MSQLSTLVQWGLLFVGCFFPFSLSPGFANYRSRCALGLDRPNGSSWALRGGEHATRSRMQESEQHTLAERQPLERFKCRHHRCWTVPVSTLGFDSQQLLFLSPCYQNSCIACWHGYRATGGGGKLLILRDVGWSAGPPSSGFVTTDKRAVLIFSRYKSPSEYFSMMLFDWVAFECSSYLIFIYLFIYCAFPLGHNNRYKADCAAI